MNVSINTIVEKQGRGYGNRLPYLDICKGLLIALLCFHHYPHALGSNGLTDMMPSLAKLMNSYYAFFFMQAFFIITGFCTNFDKRPKDFLVSNLRTLVLPAVVFEVISEIFYHYMYGLPFNPFGILLGTDMFWFLWSLFYAKVLFYFIRNLRYSRYVAPVFLTAIVPLALYGRDHGIVNVLHWQHVCTMTVFLYIGTVLRRYQEYLPRIKWISIVALLLLYLRIIVTGKDYPFATGSILIRIYRDCITYLVAATAASVAFISISSIIGHCRWLEKLGKTTLMIYGFHSMILRLFVLMMSHIGFMVANPNVCFVVTALSTLALSYLLAVLVLRSPAAVLFGK